MAHAVVIVVVVREAGVVRAAIIEVALVAE
jgi:hypothetical protein